MKKHLLFMAAACIALAFTACETEPTASVDTTEHGILLSNMDTTLNPKDDFYGYVNGNWVNNTSIPDDRTTWGGFSVLRKSTDADVLAIIAEAKESGKYAPETDQAKAIALYESYLDTTARNAVGIQPLGEALNEIEAIQNLDDLQEIMQDINAVASVPFLGISGFPDLNNSSVNAAYVGGGSLGLPDRDYYLDQDMKSEEIRSKYVEHVSRMFQLLGEEAVEADEHAKTVLALETQMAKPQLDKVQRRNPANFNNPMSRQQLQEMIPSLDVEEFMTKLDLEDIDTIMVTEPKYITALQQLLTDTPIKDIKTLLRWSTIDNNAGRLTTEIDQANWEFYAQYLNGAKQQRPMDERALATVSGVMG